MHIIKILLIVIFLLCILLFVMYHIWASYTQKNLRKLAVELFTQMDTHKIPYWADYGTFLGLSREKDIIYGDTDIDLLLIPTKDLHSKLISVINSMGEPWKLEYHSWGAYRIAHAKSLLPIYADLYLVIQKNGMYIDPTGKIPCNLVGNLSQITWENCTVNLPEYVEDALVWRYGKDWRTPKKFFGGSAVDGKG